MTFDNRSQYMIYTRSHYWKGRPEVDGWSVSFCVFPDNQLQDRIHTCGDFWKGSPEADDWTLSFWMSSDNLSRYRIHCDIPSSDYWRGILEVDA